MNFNEVCIASQKIETIAWQIYLKKSKKTTRYALFKQMLILISVSQKQMVFAFFQNLKIYFKKIDGILYLPLITPKTKNKNLEILNLETFKFRMSM